jgi:hypothetical protein
LTAGVSSASPVIAAATMKTMPPRTIAAPSARTSAAGPVHARHDGRPSSSTGGTGAGSGGAGGANVSDTARLTLLSEGQQLVE